MYIHELGVKCSYFSKGNFVLKKMYTGNPCFRTQFFEKWSILLARSSTFNVSVYTPCHDHVVSQLNEFAGKDG